LPQLLLVGEGELVDVGIELHVPRGQDRLGLLGFRPAAFGLHLVAEILELPEKAREFASAPQVLGDVLQDFFFPRLLRRAQGKRVDLSFQREEL
jgi:hypothetical protein